jgi:hypothetical protein
VTCAGFKNVDAHFAGRLPPRREVAMREHLVGCEGCRARYERHLQLAALDSRALPFQERMALALGLRRRWWPGWPAAVAVAVALGAWALVGRGALEFRPRGMAPGALVLAIDAQTEVVGFRTGGAAPALSGRRLHATEELAFAYRNGGHWPHLMVFARGERGVVYWFHPQWTDPAANPQAVALEQSSGWHELTTAVSHRFGGERLSLCALALRAPLTVREVEAATAEALADKGVLACAPVEVSP